MVFDGRWRAIEVVGGAAYFEAINSPEEHRQRLLRLNEVIRTDPHAYIEELRVTHEHIHRRVVILGEVRKDSGEVRFGVEHEGFAPDGRPVRVRVVRESEHRLVRHEHGESFRSETVLEVHGEHLIVTAVANSAEFVVKFHRI